VLTQSGGASESSGGGKRAACRRFTRAPPRAHTSRSIGIGISAYPSTKSSIRVHKRPHKSMVSVPSDQSTVLGFGR
jgi:hypothetical protein